MSKSEYVCEVCGCAVHLFRDTWKHSSNRFNLSCGKPPRIIKRSIYEAELDAVVDIIKQRSGRG